MAAPAQPPRDIGDDGAPAADAELAAAIRLTIRKLKETIGEAGAIPVPTA